jgi:hypothetical protein
VCVKITRFDARDRAGTSVVGQFENPPGISRAASAAAVAQAARQGRADVLDLFQTRGIAVALEGDGRFVAACSPANESGRAKSPPQTHRWWDACSPRTPACSPIFAGGGNTAAVRLMLDLGFDAGMARIKPDWVAGETALHVAVADGRQPWWNC